VAYVLFATPAGSHLRNRQVVHEWVQHHRVITPLLLVGLYVLLTIVMLPVWELQIAAGYGMGLVTGIFWCEIAAALGAVASMLLSRWLVGEWFEARYEPRMARLHAINEKLGHNGLLVVMGIRLCHVLPFGLSNYLFGLTRITAMDVIIGTIGGNLPTIAIGVAVGVGKHLLREWTFWLTLAAVNLVLLLPLALRYWKPEWFRRIGVE
jgi:uncharacterized membrane protein YdjX (TVP38/TMEM64 family)